MPIGCMDASIARLMRSSSKLLRHSPTAADASGLTMVSSAVATAPDRIQTSSPGWCCHCAQARRHTESCALESMAALDRQQAAGGTSDAKLDTRQVLGAPSKLDRRREEHARRQLLKPRLHT